MPKLLLPVLMAIALAGCHPDANTCSVLFNRVDGLEKGSAVLNRGISVGKVTYLDFYKDQVLVKFELREGMHIPRGSIFAIRNALLSPTYINVDYSDSTIFLTSKDTVPGLYENKSLIDILSGTVHKRPIDQSLKKIATGIGELIEAAKDSTKQPE